MRICETPIPGAFIIDTEPHRDMRGHFARVFCKDELTSGGIDFHISQASVSWNEHAGTVRGMHYQLPPHEETKLVRCSRGAIHDVIVDLRPTSVTFKKSFALELDAKSYRALLIPKGVAHGFQALADATEVSYFIDTPFVAAASAGVRWDDPAFDIVWPKPITLISERDLGFAAFAR